MEPAVNRVFLLSPANCGGARAKQVLSPDAHFALAEELRSPCGAMLGDVFTFVSGLYFRGKLTYALHFAAPPSPRIRSSAAASSSSRRARVFAAPTRWSLMRRCRRLPGATCTPTMPATVGRSSAAPACSSARSGPAARSCSLAASRRRKYVDVLLEIFGDRLRFPVEFVGRGDMSRGGLLLRKVREGTELEYVPVAGAVLRGNAAAEASPARSPRECLNPVSRTKVLRYALAKKSCATPSLRSPALRPR